MFRQMIRQVYNAETYSLTGKIENIVGMSIEASGGRAAVGDICRIYNGDSGGQVTADTMQMNLFLAVFIGIVVTSKTTTSC